MELKKELQSIFSLFKVNETFKDYKTFSSGHINDTYLILTKEKPHFVLQKINANVFTKAKEVIENKAKVSSYLLVNNCKTLEYKKSRKDNYFVKDLKNNFWNLCYYIKDSQTYTKVNTANIAFEAGKTTGNFLNDMKGFTENLTAILPNFHNMTFRFSEFENALKNANQQRKEKALNWIDFAISKKEEMTVIDKAILKHKIPLRTIHNDTKISNILFNKNEKAICLIDLDTVMQGVIHFDYGDALRTICNTSEEDEKDIKQINFNISYFKSYTEGFLTSIGKQLTKQELYYLPISPKIMAFIIGLRFLTDYLNDDVYYKTEYATHNLIRAINQFTLVQEIAKKQDEINTYIATYVF